MLTAEKLCISCKRNPLIRDIVFPLSLLEGFFTALQYLANVFSDALLIENSLFRFIQIRVLNRAGYSRLQVARVHLLSLQHIHNANMPAPAFLHQGDAAQCDTLIGFLLTTSLCRQDVILELHLQTFPYP